VTFKADNTNMAALDMETDGKQAATMVTPGPFEPAEQPAALAMPEPRAAIIASEGGGAVRISTLYPALTCGNPRGRRD
jgi:hypothetical protein